MSDILLKESFDVLKEVENISLFLSRYANIQVDRQDMLWYNTVDNVFPQLFLVLQNFPEYIHNLIKKHKANDFYLVYDKKESVNCE